MESVERNVILTGATGVVGSHILYELIDQRMKSEFIGKIIVLTRDNTRSGEPAYDRIVKVINHTYVPDFIKSYDVNEIIKHIDVVSCALGDQTLSEALKPYHGLDNCHVIHSAASTNLGVDQATYDENYSINYEGSINLMKACKPFATNFSYISTAYSCGIKIGMIKDEYSEMEDMTFRNPYEEIKNKTEIELAEICNAQNIHYQILRPSVVCGRLIDQPKYFMPKYNVVYAFASYFYSLIQKGIAEQINIRIGEDSSLHMIPVDYVAKIIAKVYTDTSLSELNITPTEGFKVKPFINKMMEVIGFKNYKFVRDLLPPINRMDNIFQSKVASSFGPYIIDEPYTFDNSKLLKYAANMKLPTAENLYIEVLKFAKAHEFKSIDQLMANMPVKPKPAL